MRTRRGIALTGEEANEELYELERAPRLVNPKSYVVKDYIAQNPITICSALITTGVVGVVTGAGPLVA